MGGLNTEFFAEFAGWLSRVLAYMDSVVIIRASGYIITLWDLYTVSTTLIAFFDCVIFPVMTSFGLEYSGDADGIIEDIDDELYDEYVVRRDFHDYEHLDF